jgi:hypothetical protein
MRINILVVIQADVRATVVFEVVFKADHEDSVVFVDDLKFFPELWGPDRRLVRPVT